MAAPTQSRHLERLRHPLRFRLAEVAAAERPTPKLVRITLFSEDFADFVSAGHDDHVKLFFPEPGAKSPPVPEVTPEGLAFPGDKRPTSRDYTPRFFDTGARTLTIDFVLHGEGPAASWAAGAEPGDLLGVGGPRASFVLRDPFDYYLLVGDETALPAIARRLEELPDAAKALALIEIADANERQSLQTPAGAELTWLVRDDDAPGTPLLAALRDRALPQGTGYAFVAGEAAMAKEARRHLVEARGFDPDRVKAAAYWHAGDDH